MSMDKTVKVYFFRTEDYPVRDFKKVFNLLTTFSGKADFLLIKNNDVWNPIKAYTDKAHVVDMEKVGFYDDPISTNLKRFPFEKQRLQLGIESTCFVVLLTNERLDDNGFSFYNLERNIVVRATGWEDYVDVNPAMLLTLIIEECIIRILLSIEYDPQHYRYDLLTPLVNRKQGVNRFTPEVETKWNFVDCLFQKKIEPTLFNLETNVSDRDIRNAIESMLRLIGKKLPKEIVLESDVVYMAEMYAQLIERTIYRDSEKRDKVVAVSKNQPVVIERKLTKEERQQKKLVDIWEPTMKKYYNPIMERLKQHSINGIVCVEKKNSEYSWQKSLGQGTKTHLVAFYRECQRAGMLNGIKYEGSQSVIRDILRNTFDITINSNDAFSLLKNHPRRNDYLLPFRKLIAEVVKEIG